MEAWGRVGDVETDLRLGFLADLVVIALHLCSRSVALSDRHRSALQEAADRLERLGQPDDRLIADILTESSIDSAIQYQNAVLVLQSLTGVSLPEDARQRFSSYSRVCREAIAGTCQEPATSEALQFFGAMARMTYDDTARAFMPFEPTPELRIDM
jgi:hypothetical protein